MDDVDLLKRIEKIEREQYLFRHEMRQQISQQDQRIHEVQASFTLLGLNDIERKVDVLNKKLLEISAATEQLKRECK